MVSDSLSRYVGNHKHQSGAAVAIRPGRLLRLFRELAPALRHLQEERLVTGIRDLQCDTYAVIRVSPVVVSVQHPHFPG